MKKHLTTILSFAMMMFMAFTASSTLTSCGEEVIIDDNHSGKTVFSASPVNIGAENSTRTIIDRDRTFFWQFNDQIWINDGGTWRKSSDSQLSADQKSANFYYDKLLTDSSYQVVYTGLNSTSATKVTIPAAFESSNSNNEIYIGRRGDCGVATANRLGDGTYSFELLHKGAYLGIAPLKIVYLNKYYAWKKIEITDVNGKAIAGTFNFGMNGIDTTSVTSPSSKITITSNMGGGFQSYNSDYYYNFVVIPPTHRKLKVKYYFFATDNPADTFVMSKQLNARQFLENNVVKMHHTMYPEYYCWDAPVTRPYDGVENVNNFNTAAPLTKATNSCATMPNPNEMAWYVMNGDPRWDKETKWTVDGGATYHTGGVWILKRNYITGFSSTTSPDGINRCSTNSNKSNSSTTYISGGKPSDTSRYFFLPALGVRRGGDNLELLETQGLYWTSYSADGTSMGQTTQPTAYSLRFTSNNIEVVGHLQRYYGFIAGNGSDWFK